MANWTLWSVSVQVCVPGEGAIVLFPELSSGAIEKKQNHTNKQKQNSSSFVSGQKQKNGCNESWSILPMGKTAG